MVVPRGQRRPGYIVHVTSLNNLASIWSEGALVAASRQATSIKVDELGSSEIKAHRETKVVPCSEGGVVADYVPFYFSARSPMLFFAHTGNPLSPFKEGQAELVHVVSHVDVIAEMNQPYAITDRNAALGYAAFADDLSHLDSLVDWTLQDQKYWHNTPAEPDRMERRMAEFLVHERCPVDAIRGLVVIDVAHQNRVHDALIGYDHPAVQVDRAWYY